MDEPIEIMYQDNIVVVNRIVAHKKDGTTQAFVPNKTCHDLGGTGSYPASSFVCSECKCELMLHGYYNDEPVMFHADEGYIISEPSYCPNCGAEVTSE